MQSAQRGSRGDSALHETTLCPADCEHLAQDARAVDARGRARSAPLAVGRFQIALAARAQSQQKKEEGT